MIIELKDNQINFVNEHSCDIVVTKDLIPNVSFDEEVIVHYEEDEDNVSHKYIVKEVTDNTITLSFVELIEDSNILLEWSPFKKKDPMDRAIKNMDKAIKTANKQEKNLIKAQEKEKKNAEKAAKKAEKDAKKQAEKIEEDKVELVLRDLKNVDGINWIYYIQESKDKWNGPHKRQAIQNLYRTSDGTLNPAVANAIVLTKEGYYVRRGLEDMYRKGKKAPQDAKELFKPLDSNYALDWNKEYTTEGPEPADTAENTDPKTNDTEITTEPTSKRFYASKALIDNFKKLAQATGLQLFDANGANMNINQLNTRNLGNLSLKVDGKNVNLTSWLRKAVETNILKEDMIMEKFPVKLDDIDLDDPSIVNIKDKIKKIVKDEEDKKIAAERTKKEEELKAKYESVLDDLKHAKNYNKTIEDQLELLHDKLVPAQGAAETVGGELVRAMMRLLYRDYNDGDKFFEGYGLETCGSSAQFLFDNGYDEFITAMLDNAYQLSDNDTKYTNELIKLAEAVINDILATPELLWTESTIDSRDYDYNFIEENQPMYEYSFTPSYEVEQLLENHIINAWDVQSYVQSCIEWEPELRDVIVGTPWSTYSSEVTVENLTKDAYDRIEDMTKHDSFWSDLVSEYADELAELEETDEYDSEEDYEESEEVDDNFDDEI